MQLLTSGKIVIENINYMKIKLDIQHCLLLNIFNYEIGLNIQTYTSFCCEYLQQLVTAADIIILITIMAIVLTTHTIMSKTLRVSLYFSNKIIRWKRSEYKNQFLM